MVLAAELVPDPICIEFDAVAREPFPAATELDPSALAAPDVVPLLPPIAVDFSPLAVHHAPTATAPQFVERARYPIAVHDPETFVAVARLPTTVCFDPAVIAAPSPNASEFV